LAFQRDFIPAVVPGRYYCGTFEYLIHTDLVSSQQQKKQKFLVNPPGYPARGPGAISPLPLAISSFGTIILPIQNRWVLYRAGRAF
jgi:hypothetical protein